MPFLKDLLTHGMRFFSEESPQRASRGASLLIWLSLLGAALGSLVLFGGIFCRCFSTRMEILLLSTSTFLWWGAAALTPGPLRGFNAIVPVFVPVVGPFLVFIALLFVKVFKRSNYLIDDQALRLIFAPPKPTSPRKPLSFEEIQEHDGQILSAGDILRWGNSSLKQALIDRFSGEDLTPSTIRILRGARQDHDEEVRLFVATILTRLEKRFQERLQNLREHPDPENPEGAMGRAYFDYLESGLVPDRLSRNFLEMALSHSSQAIRNAESFSARELLRIGSAAALCKNKDTVDLCHRTLLEMGALSELSHLRRTLLYEEGRWEELVIDLSEGGSPKPDPSLPPHLAFWRSFADSLGG